MNNIVKYRNGNYDVIFDLNTGTKIRTNPFDFFEAEFPESFDLNITNKCDGACPWCYQGCTPDGAHADIMNAKFFDSIHPYTEIAINGNDLSHPDLIPFLKKMREKKVVVSMTVNQIHWNKHRTLIKTMIDNDLIKGLGVSLRVVNEEFIKDMQSIPNAVIHLIAGIVSEEEMKVLADNNLKILILGYKTTNLGQKFIENIETKAEVESRIKWLHDNLEYYVDRFAVVSFDNKAISQLEPQRLMSEEQWNEMYMGDDLVDGKMTSASMYIDAVKGEFAANSCMAERFPLMDDITEMYQFLVKKYN